MAVISISIDENSEQIVAGFPKTVALSANIPSTIFYTLDGTTPTVSSTIYISAITIPINETSLTLKIFATNGIDSSAVISKTYNSDILNNTRLPHSPTTDVGGSLQSNYPFGSNLNNPPNVQYLNPAQAGTTVFNPLLGIIPLGYDADGNIVGTNKPIDEYQNIYSTTDDRGRSFPGVGNLPGGVSVIGRRYPNEYEPEESNRSSKLFNPKAMVIFQDASTEDLSDPPMINRQYFSAENLEVVSQGEKLRATDLETPGITGSYLKSYYNARTGMMTAYYRDSSTNKWIISSYPYQTKTPDQNNLSGMVFPKNQVGVGRVFQWHLWQYRTLI